MGTNALPQTLPELHGIVLNYVETQEQHGRLSKVDMAMQALDAMVWLAKQSGTSLSPYWVQRAYRIGAEDCLSWAQDFTEHTQGNEPIFIPYVIWGKTYLGLARVYAAKANIDIKTRASKIETTLNAAEGL